MKALVIGMGTGWNHATAYQEEGLDVIVCDTNPEKLAGCPWEQTTDYRTEIRNADIVSICTDDASHFLLATEALNHGKYVVIEKPPCLSVDEMAHLKQFDDRIYCNLPLPFHFINLIDEFRDKEPYLIECDYNWGRFHKFSEGWRADGYDIVLGAGLHMFDLLLCFKPEGWDDGAALGANKSGINGPFDCVQSIMRNIDGTLGRVGLNCGFNGDHSHRLAVYCRDYHRVSINTEKVDKTAGIRYFVQKITSGEEIKNDRLWSAMGLCFQLGEIA